VAVSDRGQERGAPKPASDRVRVRRKPSRADYDQATVYSILDQALICHVGFVEDGQPYIIPTIHIREGDVLYLHGHGNNRTLKTMGSGAPVCVEATIIDAMMFGRSCFMNALNYRSVVALGRARTVEDEEERAHVAQLVIERMIPAERIAQVRELADYELKQTRFVAFPLDECSAKIRSGAGADEERDLANEIWAGELPLRMVGDVPVPEEHVKPGTPVPAHVTSWPGRWDWGNGISG
jgi:uncharacterized protein